MPPRRGRGPTAPARSSASTRRTSTTADRIHRQSGLPRRSDAIAGPEHPRAGSVSPHKGGALLSPPPSPPITPADGRLGVLCVGLGAVTTTLIAGVELAKRGD